MQLIKCFFILLVTVCYGEAFKSYFYGRPGGGSVGSPSAKNPKTKVKIVEHWIRQRLDNFNSSNTKTWYNRYFVRDIYYRDGGPIFLLLRGEEQLSAGFMVKGAWVNYAKKFGATLFQLEHRYYGKSIPTKDLHIKNLAYLTSQQALADTANFIQKMTKKYNFKPYQKWIIFGGSYAGALSIWMQSSYPNLVYGVISSSGPVALEVDFIKYLESISLIIRQQSNKCADEIAKGFSEVQDALKNYDGQYSLYDKFMLCDTAVDLSDLDTSNLLYTLVGNFMNIVQYNNDNTKHNKVSVEDACNIMLKDADSTKAIDRLAKLNLAVLKEQKNDCVDFKYELVTRQLKNDSKHSNAAKDGDRQWIYQTCNELGFFQTSQGKYQIFGSSFPLDFFTTQCKDIFGPSFNAKSIQFSVSQSSMYYGGYAPPVSNVLSIQGSADPWHTVGITQNTTAGIQAIFINGTSHCADMYSPRTSDSADLRAARRQILNFIGKLIDSIYDDDNSDMSSSVS